MKQMWSYTKSHVELIDAALNRMDIKKMGGTYNEAYTAMQGASDVMSDNKFMFEAGRRSMRLEYASSVKSKVRAAVTKAVNTTLRK